MKKTVYLPGALAIIVCAFFISCATAPVKTPPPPPAASAGEGDTSTPSVSAQEAATQGSVETKAKDGYKESGEATAADTAAPSAKSPMASEPETRAAEKPSGGVLEFMTESSPSAESSGKPAARPREAPSTSGLRAGFADDNKQFNYFVNFLSQYAGQVPHYPIPIQERIVFKVSDASGKPVPNARVAVSGGAGPLVTGVTYADGTFLFFPAGYDAGITRYTATVSALNAAEDIVVDRNGKRQIDVRFQTSRQVYQNVPLDILFVLDTTGSMAEEIERLKATIEIINLNLSSLPSKPLVRFGLVLYRDRGDQYVTRTVPLTSDLASFQVELAKADADGGGDAPEDLQAALGDAVNVISWNTQGIRLAFIITDARPHLDYPDEKYTYADAAIDAARKGIKIFTVGTGGLDLAGELVLRQISQYTYAKYIFLTYGEEGESQGGEPGSVSHHTGANYQTDKLEAIIIRFAKEELSYLAEQPSAEEGDYFQAVQTTGEEKSATLAKLFDMAISQIVDYASIRIPAGTPTGALPIVAQSDAQALDAEYFSEQLMLSLSRNRTFSAVERKDLQALLKELELQMSGITDESNAAKLGKLIGAQMLLSSTMYDRDINFEIFVKLLRVETGEILSVTKLVVDRNLGLSASR